MESKQYKIAMVLDNPFGPDLRVLREARALVEAGNDVTIYAWDRDRNISRPGAETMDGIKINRISVKTDRQLGFKQIPTYISFAIRAYRLISQKGYDVVHCHDLPDLPIGIMLKLMKRVQLVYDAHEIYWIMEATKYPKSVLAFIRKSELWLMRNVDAFITVGRNRADYYIPHFKKNIYVVGNWYNPKAPSPQAGAELRHSLGIQNGDCVLTYAGTLSASRGINQLIDIAEEFKNNHPNIHLLVAGVGPLQKLIEDCASRNPNLHFLGWLEHPSALYSATDALIYLMDLSHPYAQYNSPNNLYLAIAWGLPLVGIKAGEIASILEEVTPSLLIDKLDVNEIVQVVTRLLEGREQVVFVQAQLKQLQSDYNWDRAKETLMSVYQSLS